jgi:hypothetical protein
MVLNHSYSTNYQPHWTRRTQLKVPQQPVRMPLQEPRAQIPQELQVPEPVQLQVLQAQDRVRVERRALEQRQAHRVVMQPMALEDLLSRSA